jgi:hypothetical protein
MSAETWDALLPALNLREELQQQLKAAVLTKRPHAQ